MAKVKDLLIAIQEKLVSPADVWLAGEVDEPEDDGKELPF